MTTGGALASLALASDDRFAIWIWVAFVLFPLLARAVAKIARSVARSMGTAEARDERRRELREEYAEEAREYEERGREAWRRLLDGPAEPEPEPEPEAPAATLPPPAPPPRPRRLVAPVPAPVPVPAPALEDAPLGGALADFAELEPSVFVEDSVFSSAVESDEAQPRAPARRALRSLLREPEGWRTAFLLHEVLGPPRALAPLADVPARSFAPPRAGDGRP